MLPDDPDQRSDTACKCGHESGDHYYRWGYCYCDLCDCWLYREQFHWDDAMKVQHGLR